MGDIGNPIVKEHMDALAGKVDVLLALAGAHATIALDELDKFINHIKPKVVIPMHYFSSKGVLRIEPVEEFLKHCKPENVTRVKSSTLELTPVMLRSSNTPHVYVLEQSR